MKVKAVSVLVFPPVIVISLLLVTSFASVSLHIQRSHLTSLVFSSVVSATLSLLSNCYPYTSVFSWRRV